MARPQKQTADYFPHDANASDSDTLTVLQGRWGNDGYAFWFRLLEKLAGSEGHVIDCRNPIKWQLLLAKTRLTEETGEEIMKALTELDAIDPELWSKHRLIWCQDLVDSIADVYKNRRRPIPVKPVITKQNAITTDDNPQSKVKESKVKKSNIYTVIFNHWNSKNIRVHRKLTDEMKRAINARNEDYSVDEILQSIDNYALILHGEEYGLMTYSWTLKEFLTDERVEKFLDLKIAQQNYLKRKGGQDGAHRQPTAQMLRNSVNRPLR